MSDTPLEAPTDESGATEVGRRTLLGLAAIAGLSTMGASEVTAESGGDTLNTDHNHVSEQWSASISDPLLDLRQNSDSGGAEGLHVRTDAPSGKAITGIATSGANMNYGINGITFGSSGAGVRGNAPSDTGSTFGVLGVCESPDGKALQGTNYATSGNGIGLEGRTDSTEGIALRGRARSETGENYGVLGKTASDDGYGVYSEGDLHVEGDLTASGTKHFVQTVSTDAGTREVAYIAVESDRAHTETSGVVELEDGRAVVELPEHFQLVTSEREDLTVQVTPYSTDADGPAVTERSTDRIVIEDLSGTGEYEVAYTVKGVRSGYENEDPVREPTGTPSPDEPSIR